jgi:hypothetical protein
VNWVPLSVMIVLGMPKRQMMLVKNETASSERTLTMGRASTHFENLSTATRRWVKPPGACRSGPTMSRFQTTKGHVIEIVCNACAGR